MTVQTGTLTNAKMSGVPALAAFSVDVEDYFQVEALRACCPRDRWTEFEDRVVANTTRVLHILREHGARGTFFVLGSVAERHPELVAKIAAEGHEVGSHGYGHELIYRMTPDEFRDDVRRTRALLQDLSGQEVLGYRAPSYTIMNRTLWALPILVEEGYRYDSSVFPIARRRYGIPRAPRWPHRWEFGDGLNIAEFPLTTRRYGPINIPATGGAYLRLLPFHLQREGVRTLLRNNRPVVLNIHPWELDPDQPRFRVSLRTRWTHYHNLDRAEQRVRELLRLTRYRAQIDVLTTLGLLL